MKTKIVLTGPESSGKTTLALALASHWGAMFVPEYARDYLLASAGAYAENDLLAIGKGQFKVEQQCLDTHSDMLICDTDLLVMEVWAEWKYAHCHPWIHETLMRFPGDLYILCDPDIPWEYDPLREHPEQRHALYAVYKKKLDQYGFKYTEVSGNEEDRLSQSNDFITTFLKNNFFL